MGLFEWIQGTIRMHASHSSGYGALLSRYGALLSGYGALLSGYGALLS